jgi:hypothetical protein
MELSLRHFWAFSLLLIGASSAIRTVEIFVQHKSILGTVLFLSFSISFTALGLLELFGLIDPEWFVVSGSALLGIYLLAISVSALYSPPQPRFPKWTQWAMLVFGVGLLLIAPAIGMHFYWR